MRLLSFLLALVSFCSYAQISTDTVLVKKDTVSIIGVGDIMMGTNYPEDKLPSEDGAFLLRDVEKVLSDADVTFGNLEGTLLDSGGVPKKCKYRRNVKTRKFAMPSVHRLGMLKILLTRVLI
jgi:hypothetical protein